MKVSELYHDTSHDIIYIIRLFDPVFFFFGHGAAILSLIPFDSEETYKMTPVKFEVMSCDVSNKIMNKPATSS